MKNSNFFLLAITAATVVSCGTHPSSYTINGTVSDTTLNGNKVYLTDMASRNVLDSAVIANGKFTFTGKADTALICQIQSRPYRMELVLENGDIAVFRYNHVRIVWSWFLKTAISLLKWERPINVRVLL